MPVMFQQASMPGGIAQPGIAQLRTTPQLSTSLPTHRSTMQFPQMGVGTPSPSPAVNMQAGAGAMTDMSPTAVTNTDMTTTGLSETTQQANRSPELEALMNAYMGRMEGLRGGIGDAYQGKFGTYNDLMRSMQNAYMSRGGAESQALGQTALASGLSPVEATMMGQQTWDQSMQQMYPQLAALKAEQMGVPISMMEALQGLEAGPVMDLLQSVQSPYYRDVAGRTETTRTTENKKGTQTEYDYLGREQMSAQLQAQANDEAIKWAQLAQQKELAFMEAASRQDIAGMQVASQERMAAMNRATQLQGMMQDMNLGMARIGADMGRTQMQTGSQERIAAGNQMGASSRLMGEIDSRYGLAGMDQAFRGQQGDLNRANALSIAGARAGASGGESPASKLARSQAMAQINATNRQNNKNLEALSSALADGKAQLITPGQANEFNQVYRNQGKLYGVGEAFGPGRKSSSRGPILDTDPVQVGNMGGGSMGGGGGITTTSALDAVQRSGGSTPSTPSAPTSSTQTTPPASQMTRDQQSGTAVIGGVTYRYVPGQGFVDTRPMQGPALQPAMSNYTSGMMAPGMTFTPSVPIDTQKFPSVNMPTVVDPRLAAMLGR